MTEIGEALLMGWRRRWAFRFRLEGRLDCPKHRKRRRSLPSGVEVYLLGRTRYLSPDRFDV